jgi:amino acid transporter
VSYLCALPVLGDDGQAKIIAAEVKRDRLSSDAMEAKAHAESLRAALAEAEADGFRLVDKRDAANKQLELAKKYREDASQSEELAAEARARIDNAYAGKTEELGISHARDDRVGTAAMQLISPRLGAPLMAIAIMVSTFGCLNGLILAGARLYWAMARDGLFFRPTGVLNARGVPAAGLVLQGIWSVLLIFSGTYSELLDYVIFAALLFYVLTVSGLFILRVRKPDAERPYRALGYPLLPLVYVVVCTLIMLDLLIVKPGFTWPGLAIVLTGVPAYFIWRQVGQPAPVSAVES